jgi:hypothetical protein
MQNIKYHIINTAAVLLFSYASASTINQAVKYSLAPDYSPQNGRASGPGAKRQAERKSGQEELVGAIVGSGFFRMGGDNTSPDAAGAPAPGESIDRLTLMGTITGPWSIARALIKKDGEREPVIFALYRVNSESASDVIWIQTGQN